MRFLMTVIALAATALVSFAQTPKPCHNAGPARCNPYGICRACSTCSSCAYCKYGGRCSVCGGQGATAPKATSAARRAIKRG